jgi:hypothetical protein
MAGERHAMCESACRLRLKCDNTGAETRFRLSAQRTSPFKSAGESVRSTTGRRAVHISLQGLYCSCKPVFCSHVTLTGYPLYFLVFPFTSPPVRHRVPSNFTRSIPILQEVGFAPGPAWTRAENLVVAGIGSPDRPACSESDI